MELFATKEYIEERFVTKEHLKQELSALEARFDAKLEIFTRRIIDDLSGVIRDVVDHMDRRFQEEQKDRKRHAKWLASADFRQTVVEAKLNKAGTVLLAHS